MSNGNTTGKEDGNSDPVLVSFDTIGVVTAPPVHRRGLIGLFSQSWTWSQPRVLNGWTHGGCEVEQEVEDKISCLQNPFTGMIFIQQY